MLRIDLTPPQSDFTLLPHKYRLFVGGFGSGKTHTLVANAFADLLDQDFPGGDVAVYAPTYDLLKLNLEPRIDQWLTEGGFDFNFNKTDHIFDVQGYGKMICRSLDNPSRIIAYEVFRSHIDELDTLSMVKATEVWEKIQARNRQKVAKKNLGGPKVYGKNRVSAYTTPEGFRFTYDRWGKRRDVNYGFVRAPTYSNPHLPDDYVDSLRRDYPAQLVDAYIEGLWTNLTAGTVYSNFDRDFNSTLEVETKRETLHVGMDFNVGKMAAIVHVIRQGMPIAVGEFIGVHDTPTMAETLQEAYPDRRLIIYPDASGKSRDTRGSPTGGDLRILRDAGFRVDAPRKNPPIKDRVLSMNAMFRNGEGLPRYWVNVDRCPEYTLCLEQQAWDPKTGLPDKTTDMDHPVDAAGYFIHRKYPVERKVFGRSTIIGA